MNLNQNLRYGQREVQRLFNDKMIYKLDSRTFRSCDNWDVIKEYFRVKLKSNEEMIVGNITTDEVPANINKVFNKSTAKWYIRNDQDTFEEYGVYADTLDTTTYLGKLAVIEVDGNQREYEWNGTEWVDLGEYVMNVSYLETNATYTGCFNLGVYPVLNSSNKTKMQVKFLVTGQSPGGSIICGTHDAADNNDWRFFYGGGSSTFYYDLGDGRMSWNLSFNTIREYEFGDYYVKDLVTSTMVKTSSTRSVNPSAPLYIFNKNGGADYARIYYFKYWNESGSLVYDLIPAQNNGVFCFKNKVDNTFIMPTRGVVNAGYIASKPKEYETIPAPALSVNTNTYNEILQGEYTIGQQVSMDKSVTYTIAANRKLEMPPTYCDITNEHGSWVVSSVVKDGYDVYQSNDSHNIDTAFDYIKVQFNEIPDFTFLYGSYAESNYDYTVVFNLDVEINVSTNPRNITTDVAYSSKGYSSSDAPNRQGQFVNDGGVHFFYVGYGKDGSASNNNDRGYIAIPTQYNSKIIS